jgi:hypothetical protein
MTYISGRREYVVSSMSRPWNAMKMFIRKKNAVKTVIGVPFPGRSCLNKRGKKSQPKKIQCV